MRKNILLHVIGLSLAALLSTGALVSCGGDNPATPDDPNKENPVPNPPGPTPGPVQKSFPTTPEAVKESAKITEALAASSKTIIDSIKALSSSGVVDAKAVAKAMSKLDHVLSAEVDSENENLVLIQQEDKVYVNLIVNDDELTGGGSSWMRDFSTETWASSPHFNTWVSSLSSNIKTSLSAPSESVEKKALLLSPYNGADKDHDRHWNYDINHLRSSLQKIGYKLDAYLDDDVTFTTFRGDYLADYGLIIIGTHGNVDVYLSSEKTRTTVIYTSIPKNATPDDLTNKALLIRRGVKYYGVTVEWLEATTTKKYPNSIVIVEACLTAKNDKMANYFFDHEAIAYAGNEVSSYIALFRPRDNVLIDCLCEGMEFSLAREYANADESVKKAIDHIKIVAAEEKETEAEIKESSDPDHFIIKKKKGVGEVYLFDPRPFNPESHVDASNGTVKLSWEMPKSTGKYQYEVVLCGPDDTHILTDFKQSDNKFSCEFALPAQGHYDWWVNATLIHGGEEVAYYSTDVEKFDYHKPDFSLSTDVIDFTNVPVGSTRKRELTITNINDIPATISSVECPDGFSTDFKGERTVKSGEPFVLSVRFSPTKKETYNGVIKINSGSDTYEVEVTGTGSDRSDGKVELSPSKIVFGDYDVGDYDTKILYVKNTGTDECYVSSIDCPDGFEADPAGDFVIEKNKTKTVKVTFRPTMGRDYRGELTVQSDASNGDQSIIVSGTGIQQTPAQLVLSTDALSFGTVDVGKTKTISFRISNQGTMPAHVEGIYCSSGFSADITNSLVIDGGASLVVNVTFAPTAEKPYTGLLTVESDAVDPEVTLDLAGVGSKSTSTELTVSETKLVFGEVREGEKAVKSIMLTNSGTRAINVSTISCPDGFTTDMNDNISIPAKASIPVKVTFHSTLGVHKGDLIIRSDADNGDQFVQVSGIGLESPKTNLILSTHSIDFGEVIIGDLAVKQFTATNTGSRPIKISAISCPAGFAPNYTEPLTLQAGSVLTVEILFKPTASSHSGNVVIKSDADNGDQTVSVTGKGAKQGEPILSFTTDMVEFGEAKVGANATQKIGIVNSGQASAYVSSFKLPVSFVTDLKEKTEIKANSTMYFNVQFVPQRARTYNGMLYVEFADNVAPKSLTLYGIGKEPVAGIVDLGLSVYWATCNLDASSPEGIGGYYAFGETSTKSEYTWENYKWYDTQTGYTKYNSNSQLGIVDNRTVLEPADDAVTVKKGGLWRTPTVDEVDELLLYCSYEYITTAGGVKGCLFTSEVPGFTDKSIFMPFSGYRYDDEITQVGEAGYYQESTPHWHLYINSNDDKDKVRACDGQNIRPVYGAPAKTNAFDFKALQNKALAMDKQGLGNGQNQHNSVELPKRDRPAPLE